MPTHERRLDRGKRLARRWLASIGEEFREARLDGGLTQEALGRVVGLSHSQVSRIERGLVPGVSFDTLAILAAALGLDLPLRAFPAGDPVRDAAQLRLLAEFRSLLPGALRHRTEVPIGPPGDHRAWDEVIDGVGWSLPVEAETRIRDTQSKRRTLALKCRDAGVDRILLLVTDTRHNRHVLRLAADDFAEQFPLPGKAALASLQRGELPAASSIVFVRVPTRRGSP